MDSIHIDVLCTPLLPQWCVLTARHTKMCIIQALIKKNYHQLGSLKNRNLFHTVLEAGKPQTKVSANSVPHEGLGCWWTSFCWVLTWCRAEGGSKFSHVSSYKGTKSSWGLHPHNLITSQRPHLQTPSHGVFKSQYINLGGNINI